jgi:hypothetical protein
MVTEIKVGNRRFRELENKVNSIDTNVAVLVNEVGNIKASLGNCQKGCVCYRKESNERMEKTEDKVGALENWKNYITGGLCVVSAFVMWLASKIHF